MPPADALRLSDTFSIGEPAQAQNPQQKTHLQKKGGVRHARRLAPPRQML